MKQKLQIFLTAIMLILLSATMLHAQTDVYVQVGTGSSENYHVPIEPYYGYTYSQCIYWAGDLEDIGVGGIITHLAWEYDLVTTLNVSNRWDIYIGHTSKTSFTSTNNWISAYSMTKVYGNYIGFSTGHNWKTIDITDWEYDGTSNIVIAVHEKRSGYNSSSDEFRCSTRPANNCLVYYSDGYNPNPYSPPTARYLQNRYANIRFTYESAAVPDPLAHTVQADYDAASSVSAVDMDDDGDMDMLGTARSAHDITWWENNGIETFTQHTIDGSFLYANDSYAVDMDGDGDMDVIGAAAGDNSVIAWWENNGSESFTKHIIFRGNDGPDYTFQGAEKVHAADIDGDGDIDVAAIADTDGSGSIGDVRWWQNDGSMGFGTMYSLATTMYGAGSIQIKDINGDNLPDLLMATWYGDMVVWFENEGDVGDHFKEPVAIKYSWEDPRSAFAIDMDNDGDMDVVASAYTTDDVSWFSSSTPSTPVWTQTEIDHSVNYQYHLYPADLDGDGDVDVLTSSYYPDKLTWYENDGNTPWAENEIIGTTSALTYFNPLDAPQSCSVADMDSDGDMDYLVADYNSDLIMWYENNTTTIDAVTFVDGSSGGEEFTQSISSSTINQAVGRFKLTAATETVSLASAEIKLYGVRSGLSNFKLWQSSNNSFDSGSDIQLATAVEFDPGNGKTIEFKDFVSPILTAGTYYFLTADAGTFTGDINAAIINNSKLVLSGATHSTTIDNNYLANSAGVFVKHSIQTSYTDASSIYSVDLDQDGDMDMLGTSETLDDITWWENDGNESFTEHTIYGSFDGANDVYVADIDGDGDLDVLGSASTGSAGDISYWENDGSEGFTKRTISTGYNNASSISAADLDGDGDIDVAATNAGDGAEGIVVWFVNDGASPPGWATSHVIGTGLSSANSIYITDINKDSKLDILFYMSSSTYWFENNGTGDYFETYSHIYSNVPLSVFAIDINNNGYMDVLSISSSTDDVRWYHENTPTNSPWTEAAIDATYTDGLDIYATDIDGDGTVDILTSQGSGADNDLSWFSNNGSETFTQNDLASTFDNAKSVFAVDVDKDGDMDLLAASYGSNEIAWWEKTGAPTPTVAFADGGTTGGNFTQVISGVNSTLARFKLTASTGTVSLVCAQIMLDGSRSGLSNFKLWQSSDDSWAVSDILLGSGIAHDPGNGETIKFNDFVSPVLAAGTYYFLTADASSFSGNILPIMVDDTKLGLSGATHSTFIDGNYLSNNTDGIFAKRSLVTDYGAASSVFSIDLDQDGDMDVITTSETEHDVDWWENDGSENFTKHTINSSTIYTVKDACAGDIDGDGDIDVLTASTHTTGEITWWENDGSEGFTKRSISTAYNDANSICAADIDGDGDIDVVATSSDGSTNGTIVWFESSGASPPVWTTHDIFTSGYDGAGSVYITDIDADSKLDIVIKATGNIFWFENNLPTGFNAGVAITSTQGANSAYAIDVDNNGKMDVVGTITTDDAVTWYKTDAPTTPGWTGADIETTYTDGLDIYATDINGDGDVDVLTSQENGTFDISFFDNDGSESFTETEVADNFTEPRSIFSIDIDSDGDMDILAAAFTDDEIAWWEQLGTPDATVAFTDGSDYTQIIAADNTNQPIGRFQLTASADVVGLLSAEIGLYGTRTDLSNFKLWQSSDDTWAVSDILLGSGVAYDPGNGNTIKFKDFVSPVASGGIYYFVTVDAGASFEGDILCKIVSTDGLTLSGATHSSTISYASLSGNTIDYDYLDAVTTNVTNVVTTTSMATAASVTIDVGPNTTDVEYVMVASSFNFKNNTEMYAQREAYFKLTGPGSQTGPTLARYVSANTIGAESCAIGTAVYIFDVSTLTGNQTFLLQQQHSGESVKTTASITAVSLSTKQNHYDLDHDFQSITSDVTTTSSTFESVTGLQTNDITLPLAGDVFVMASINSASSAAAVAQYQLESSNDDGDTWSALGRPMRRSLSSVDDNGIISLVGVLEDQPTTGIYKFRVAALKVSGGDIYTKNSTIVALALAHDGGYFPTIYKADVEGATTASTSFVNATTTSPFNVEPARGGSGPNLFVAAQYLMEASNLDESGQALQAGEQVELTGASTVTTPEYNRCVPGNANKGSGGYIGLMTGLTGDGEYSIALDQRVADIIGGSAAGDEALTTSEIILAGFQTFDRLPTASVRPYGDGTSGDPYQIQILANLLWMTENPAEMASGKYYIQTADIDAYETNGWNSGAGFVGITGSSTGFEGSYDGQNYTISGLTIDRSTVDQIGLFKKIDGATIANIGLINVDIIGKSYVGGIYGEAVTNPCTVDNCYVTGTVTGTITGTGNTTGFKIGGIGGSGDVTITKSYSEADVSGCYHIGSFVGWGGTITNCYSKGDVIYSYIDEGNEQVSGAFVGFMNGVVLKSYTTGSVTASTVTNPTQTYTSGFGGTYDYTGNTGTCFFDEDVSNQTSDVHFTLTYAAIKTTTQMTTESTFTDASWDFADIWDIYEAVNDGYPYFGDMGEITWSGGTSAVWDLGDNWKNSNSAPTSINNISIPDTVGTTDHFPVISDLQECHNLTVESNAELKIAYNGSFSVSGDLVNNGTITIESTASGTGSLIVNGTVSGNVVIERFVEDGAWHLVSPSTTGITSNSFYIDGSNPAWLTTFIESGSTAGSWSYIESLTQSLAIGTGYAYQVDDGSKADNTVSFTGDIRTTDVVKTLAYTDVAHGWNFFGNPYSSALDWDEGTWDKSKTSGFVYVWDQTINSPTGDYRIASTGSPALTDGIIPIGQGFFVDATVGGSFTIPEDARVHSTQGFYKSTEEEDESPFVRIQLDGDNIGNTLFIGFPDFGTDERDYAGDARKLYSSDVTPQLFAIENGLNLCVNTKAPLTEENSTKTIPVNIIQVIDGDYTLSISQLERLPHTLITLEDLQTGTTQDFVENPVYSFTASESDDAARFLLHFGWSPDGIHDTEATNINIYAYGKNVYIRSSDEAVNQSGNVFVYDMLGREIVNTQISGGQLEKITVNVSNAYVVVKVVKVVKDGVVKTENVFIK